MGLKLNLGAGKVIFPLTDREHVPWPEHLNPLPDSVFEPGWVNVDKYPNPGIQEVIDLFRFPWIRSSNGNPWNADSVHEIHASHIVEHIPHQVSAADGLPPALRHQFVKQTEHLDGFFVFFAECWRILKPDGLVYVRCPWGPGVPGMADPSHTRYLIPGSFSYLANDNSDAPFDYHLPLRFALAEPVVLRLHEPHASQVAKMELAEAEQLVYMHFNVADEIRVVLRAVKDEGESHEPPP